jgi:hypothetical protein
MRGTLRARFAFLVAGAVLFIAGALAGCAGPSPRAIADWHDGVVAVRDQSALTFKGVNDLVREAQIKRAATLPSLKEADFHPGLDAESIAAWNRALDSLAAYGAALSTLLGTPLTQGVGDATKGLAESIAATSKSDILAKRPGLASALGKLAGKLASVAAARSAKTIMAEADEPIGEVLDQMARMINDDTGGAVSGVYQTVHSHWTLQADEVRVEFLRAPPAEKRNVAARYAGVLERRDASDAALVSLRRSLLELRVAHARAAAGGAHDTSALIANVHEQIRFLKDLLADLKPAKG